MKKTALLAIAMSAVMSSVYAGAEIPAGYGGEVNSAPDGAAPVDMHVVEHGEKAGAPIKLDADRAEYDQDSGNFFAEGNVVLRQNGQVLRTDYAEGNMKTGDIFLKNGGSLTEGDTTMQADWVTYNFLQKNGQLTNITGCNHDKLEWYRSQDAEIKDGKLVCEHGATISKCPSVEHPACLSVVAKHFEIIPNDKMIAKDCWVLVRGKKVFHRARWINDLTKQRQTMIRPRVGYDSDKGMRYELSFDQPLWKDGSVGGNFTYYGHDHYKPNFWIKQNFEDFVVGVSNGWEEDDDDWYKKQTNWTFNWKRHRLIKGLPLTYSAYVEHGLWKRKYEHAHSAYGEYSPRSWHTEYGVYLYHDPIHLFDSERNSLNLYVGKKWVRESLSDLHTSTNTYGATITQKIGDNFTAWLGYYDEHVQDNRLFDIGQADMAKELRPGVKYITDNKRDEISAVYRLNTQSGRYGDYDYGHRYGYYVNWTHHFCCWDLVGVYEREFAEQDRSLKFRFEFSFM